MQDISNIKNATRIHHPTKESYVVSAEEAKELFKQGWYPRRKMASEAKPLEEERLQKEQEERIAKEAAVTAQKEADEKEQKEKDDRLEKEKAEREKIEADEKAEREKQQALEDEKNSKGDEKIKVKKPKRRGRKPKS